MMLNFFHVLVCQHASFSVKYLFKFSAYFLIVLAVFLLSFESSLYILETSYWLDMLFAVISPSL